MAIFSLTALISIMNHAKHMHLTWDQEITRCSPNAYLPRNSFPPPKVLDFFNKRGSMFLFKKRKQMKLVTSWVKEFPSVTWSFEWLKESSQSACVCMCVCVKFDLISRYLTSTNCQTLPQTIKFLKRTGVLGGGGSLLCVMLSTLTFLFNLHKNLNLWVRY